jgi:hypothetical protein
LHQSWRASPTTHAPRRTLRPRLAARSVWSRIEAIDRNREFLVAYRDARAGWLGGGAVVFPSGTYWLRRFAHVPVAT